MAAISKALVIGGGIGGLTAAIALRQEGIDVDLIEIARELTVYGVGIIQPNNILRALNQIGVARACVEAGAAFPGWQIYSSRGDLLMVAPSPQTAAPGFPAINGITRPKLHQILTSAAESHGAKIYLGESVADFSQQDDSVVVTMASGRVETYDLVIACDGLNSHTRTKLFPEASGPRFTGQGVWRYNLPRPATMEWGGIYFGPNTKVGLVPLSPETMYMFLVTAEPGNPWHHGEGLAGEMRARLAQYEGLVSEMAELITDANQVVYRPMHNVMLPAPWFKDRIIIIGDAAHATTPHLAQGAAMAVEDAVLLAQLLGEDRPVPAVMDEFMSRRFARGQYVVETSTQLATWELDAWDGRADPDANPGKLLHDATVKLMESY